MDKRNCIDMESPPYLYQSGSSKKVKMSAVKSNCENHANNMNTSLYPGFDVNELYFDDADFDEDIFAVSRLS